MKKRIKINALIVSVALFLCAWFPRLLLRLSETKTDELMEVFGTALILFGLLLRISARGYKAEYSAKGNALVTGGPYGLVRNPMYLGILVCGVGVVLVVGQWWGLALFLAGFFLQYLYLFKKEEALLERLFGEEYRQYKKKVPRILPSPVALFRGDLRELLPLKWEWFRRELMSVVLVLGGVATVEFWEEIVIVGWKGVFHSVVGLLGILAMFGGLISFLSINNAKSPKDDNDTV